MLSSCTARFFGQKALIIDLNVRRRQAQCYYCIIGENTGLQFSLFKDTILVKASEGNAVTGEVLGCASCFATWAVHYALHLIHGVLQVFVGCFDSRLVEQYVLESLSCHATPCHPEYTPSSFQVSALSVSTALRLFATVV